MTGLRKKDNVWLAAYNIYARMIIKKFKFLIQINYQLKLIGLKLERLILYKIKVGVVLAGLLALSLKWKVNILYSQVNFWNYPNNSVLIATLTQWVAAVAGQIIAWSMFTTTVVLAHGRIIPTLQWINRAGLIIMVQLRLN